MSRRLPTNESFRARCRATLLASVAGPGAPLALFTAEGMLRGWVRYQLKGIGPVFPSTVRNAYARWRGEPGSGSPGWLITHPAIFPLRTAANRAIDSPNEPNVLPRIAPAGLFMAPWLPAGGEEKIAATFRLGSEIASLTHSAETDRNSAGALALLVALLANGNSSEQAESKARAELRRHTQDDAPWDALSSPEVAPILDAARDGHGPAPITPALCLLVEEVADDLAASSDWSINSFVRNRETDFYADRYPPN